VKQNVVALLVRPRRSCSGRAGRRHHRGAFLSDPKFRTSACAGEGRFSCLFGAPNYVFLTNAFPTAEEGVRASRSLPLDIEKNA